MGVPPVIMHFSGIVPYQPTILGVPQPFWGYPHGELETYHRVTTLDPQVDMEPCSLAPTATVFWIPIRRTWMDGGRPFDLQMDP